MNFSIPTRISIVCLFACIFAGAVANAASFNCEKAQSAIEKMICSDASLSVEDSELAKVFDVLKTHIADTASIVTDQRNWLKVVRDKCETVACLQAAYQARTGYLSRLNARLQLAVEHSDDVYAAQKCEVATPKQSKAGCKVDTAVCVENSNYSILQAISSRCGEVVHDKQEMNVGVYLYSRKESSAILVGTMSKKETPAATGKVGGGYPGILWGEPDRNGFAELYIQHECIRSCDGVFYKFDPSQQLMYKYHEGDFIGYHANLYFDGYLLDEWNGSGTSGYNVFKVHQVGIRDIVDEDSFTIEYGVATTGAEDAPVLTNECWFYKYDSGLNPHRVKPPNKKWYKYCSPKGVPGKGLGYSL